MTNGDAKTALESALAAMTDPNSRSLYDVTIVCTTDDHQAEYWTSRLSQGVCRRSSSSSGDGDAASLFPVVLAVSEDWSAGGAGNGLGTLYAYQKAGRVAKERHGIDLDALLADGTISAALYHTAGKGTRLAPLPASENNNKPGVKLPVCHELSDGSWEPLTVLEAVVRQTGIYASSRKGRLSVFWGDQVFIPSAPFSYTPTHHVDIMCTLLGDKAPTAKEWSDQGLEKYGVIAVSTGDAKDAAQVEKVDHATAVKMLESLGDIGQVGPSLGSFSVSSAMLRALCKEYAPELAAKAGKFDTDPHFWMPLTLPAKAYVSLMSQKGVSEDVSTAHHERMARMKAGFSSGGMGLFGAVDVGSDAAWWDYGLLKLYFKNNISLIDSADEHAELYRRFLGVTSKRMQSSVGAGVEVDDSSCVFASSIKSGSVSGSVLASVNALDVQADGAIIVNCTAKSIRAGKNAILYNLVDDSDEGIVAGEGDVLVSVTEEDGTMMELRSKHHICGGQAWKEVLDGNTLSFEQMHLKNRDSNVTAIEKKRKDMHRSASDSFGL